MVVGIIGLLILLIIIVVPVVVIKERDRQKQLDQQVNRNGGYNQGGNNNNNNNNDNIISNNSNSNGNNTSASIDNTDGYSVYRNGDGIINGHIVSKYANLTRIQTIKADALANKERVFVVGDIHGCLDEFNQLLDHIQFNPSTDQVILAGDMIAKGPSNTGVIRRAKEIGALCVRGNHDDKAIRFKTYERSNGPDGMGPSSAVMPEGDVPDPLKYKNPHLPISRELSDEDYDYLTSCPSILRLPSMNNSIVVHGGLDPMVSDLVQQQPLDVMTMRDISDTGEPTDEKRVGTPWAQAWNEAQEKSNTPLTVYYGHDASRGLVIQPFSYGLDTGCVYGRNLTTIDIKTKQIFSVPCKEYAT
ncbi:Metallo-dependent phosphatase-like protein [Halteromyces radiatus]|uniref:Metallo-dependent phosphatase-like protein n=1 Tax=Halteromyces radiatus TaxID=101107 RepID=UPI00221E9A2F|nr:Metallo-dependent phosphatase-like protein [Halteromyces radiatus]KAI8085151.1 Metallo-dependent phosphatase-like protein [Halteromyces radiatus]